MTATKVLQRRETAQPRTVLAYYGAITGLVLGGVVGAVSTLAATGVSTYLIPWLLGFGALIVVAVLVGVFVVMLKDPSRLMLGQVSGREYAEIQQVRLGDSVRGERAVFVDARDGELVEEQPVLELPSGESEEEE